MSLATGSCRLCKRCRNDVLKVFERGFCEVTPHTRANRQPLIKSRHQVSTGSFSYQSRHASSKASAPSTSAIGRVTPQRTSVIEEVDVQEELATLKELETLLGRPIEDAIEDDRKAGIHSESAAQDGPNNNAGGTSGGHVGQRATTKAGSKKTGASAEEIVKQARHIHRDHLPDNVLTDDQMKLYKRLYGEPGKALDASFSYEDGDDTTVSHRLKGELGQALLDTDGQEISVITQPQLGHGGERPVPVADASIALIAQDAVSTNTEDDEILEPVERYLEFAPMQDTPSRQRDVASALGAEIIDEGELDSDLDPERSEERVHPMTILGRFSTQPQTLSLPYEAYVRPVQKIMSDFSNKQLRNVCEKTFGGPGLPDSALTPRHGRLRQQVPIPIDAAQSAMGSMEANAFVTAIMPPVYASIMAVLVETRKRLGPTWLTELLAREGGPRVLDTGSGGAGILAWREVIRAHWESLHTSDRKTPPPPSSKAVVLTGSDTLRDRAAKLLENTTFIPRLPDYVHTRDTPTLDDERPMQSRKQFDVIIASHTLYPMNEEFMRKQQVQNLWSMLNPNGGVLIVIEKGVPRGFEAVAGARDLLLDRYILNTQNESTTDGTRVWNDHSQPNRSEGMIVAPCTNHKPCPMYREPGKSKGRKDFCGFQQRYLRPPHLQRVLGAKDRNHDDVDFSYISVIRGRDIHSKQLTTWEAMANPMSTPTSALHSDTVRETSAWMGVAQRGFEQFTPDKVASENADEDTEISFTYPDGIPRSTLPSPLMLPRVVYPPLKRHGHVTLDLCTPMGEIERWTIPKSFSRQAYRDARKSRWGDLWALGAKTCVPRNLRLGGLDTEVANLARKRAERLQNKAEEQAEILHEKKLAALDLQRDRERPTRRIETPRSYALHEDLAEWAAEFEADAQTEDGMRGGAIPKNFSSSKAARRLQKTMART